MINYKYKCTLCKCMFTKYEIVDFRCNLCKEQGVDTNTVYACKRCLPKKRKSKQLMTEEEKEFYRRVEQSHLEEEHGPVNMSGL